MEPFKIEYLAAFPNILEYCVKADGCQGGTIHQYLPRMKVSGPAKGIRYGQRPIVQVYLDGKPLDRGFSNIYLSDLAYYSAVQ